MNTKSSDKLLSWKETWQISKKALQLIRRTQPGIITVYLMSCAWSALTPYAGIWLLALILGSWPAADVRNGSLHWCWQLWSARR